MQLNLVGGRKNNKREKRYTTTHTKTHYKSLLL